MLRLLIIVGMLCLTACDQSPPAWQWQVLQSGTHASLRGVSAVDENVVWASGSGGTVLRSVDGGAHWQMLSPADAEALDFRDIQVFDQDTAVLMSAGNGTASKIFKTINGGQDWQLHYTNDYPEGFFNGMAFWNRQQGILYSDAVEGKFLVLLTEDGGESWHEANRDTLPDALPGEHAYAASGTGIAVAGDGHVWFATGGAAPRVFKSADYGRSWRVTQAPIVCDSETAGIFALSFFNAQTGIAMGGDHQRREARYDNVAFTTDGGQSWLPVVQPPVGLRTAAIYFDAQTLLIVGSHGSDYSQDGGRHWQAISEQGYYAVAHGGDIAFAVGADGRIGKLYHGR